MPNQSKKMDAVKRKEAILVAAAPVFARLGRDGATTKDIAKAAGVSEALLYKHFSGKEALYEALEGHCVDANAVGTNLFNKAPPSTETLVKGVAVLVQAVFPGIGSAQSHEDTKRLVTASLLGDGSLAKAFLDKHLKPWIAVFENSLQAAQAAGDIEEGVQVGQAEIWFVHHLAHTLHLISLPKVDLVDYNMSKKMLIESTVRFLLRGLGLKNSAITQYYKPEDLKTIFEKMNQEQ